MQNSNFPTLASSVLNTTQVTSHEVSKTSSSQLISKIRAFFSYKFLKLSVQTALVAIVGMAYSWVAAMLLVAASFGIFSILKMRSIVKEGIRLTADDLSEEEFQHDLWR